MKTTTRICKKCQNVFSIPAWRKEQKFCSRACANAPGEMSPHWQGGGVKLVCRFCKKQFHVRKHRKEIAIYCSRHCATSDKSGIGASHWQGGSIEKTCLFCGISYKTKKALADSGKFCSKKCHDMFRVNRQDIKCPTCGAINSKRQSDVKRGRIYCGTRCFRMSATTSIERAIRKELEIIGIEFIPEYKIKRWSIDVYIPTYKIAIECDGSYWHRSVSAIERDRRKDAFLETQGITVLRLPEYEIRNSIQTCVQSITSLCTPN